MQSFLQYRRLRREVQEDLARGKEAKHPAAESWSSASTPDPEKGQVAGGDQTPDSAATRDRPAYGSADGPLVPGVTVSRPEVGDDASVVFVVGWKENDAGNPQNWSLTRKWVSMVTYCILAIAITIPASVEGPSQEAFDAHFGVSTMAGSMTTGIFLIGVGVGSLPSGPLSETFGRNGVYFSTMILVMLFILGKALAPNYGAALAFRFLGGFVAAAPMTVAGGTIGDVWTPMQLPFGLPFATIASYVGPILGPVVGAYTPEIGVAWADWISLIIIGAALVIVLLGHPETYSPVLLEWRARHLRELTGDQRYRAQHESAGSLGSRMITNLYRPFTMIWTEPIILIFTFYLVLLYFVLFTFLNGYPFIFTEPYGISTSLTFMLWTAMIPGIFVAIIMLPPIYHLTKKAAKKAIAAGQQMQPEVSLYWAMAGASILLPVSLFWMAWTCYSDISIWSPIIASGVFGYALVCIFTTSYMYIIFVYQQYAASALGFMTFARYVISGALTPASVKMYENLGPHLSLTISAAVATVMAPVPFVLYKYGHSIRAMSRNAQNKA